MNNNHNNNNMNGGGGGGIDIDGRKRMCLYQCQYTSCNNLVMHGRKVLVKYNIDNND